MAGKAQDMWQEKGLIEKSYEREIAGSIPVDFKTHTRMHTHAKKTQNKFSIAPKREPEKTNKEQNPSCGLDHSRVFTMGG